MPLRDIAEPERGLARFRDVVWLAVLLATIGAAWGTVRTETRAMEDRLDRLEARVMVRLQVIENEIRQNGRGA